MIVFEDMIKIFDTRRIRVKSRYELTDIAKEIYLLCGEPKSHKTILETLTKNYGEDEIEGCLNELRDWKLLLNIKDEFLALAVERPQESLFSLLFMNAGWFIERQTKRKLRGIMLLGFLLSENIIKLSKIFSFNPCIIQIIKSIHTGGKFNHVCEDRMHNRTCQW